MSSGWGRCCLIVLLGMPVLAGCTRVETLAGVTLAAPVVAPTPTPLPTATPPPQALILPRMVSKEFTGTTVGLHYPDGWAHTEGGQSLRLFDPAYPAGNGPGVTLWIALTRTIDLDASPDGSAPQALERFLGQAAAAGFVPGEAVPGEDAAFAFLWGDHDSAFFRWQSGDRATQRAHVLVLSRDKRRFVLLTTAMPAALWPDFEPTWLAILSSVTLDGAALPAADMLAAWLQAAST